MFSWMGSGAAPPQQVKSPKAKSEDDSAQAMGSAAMVRENSGGASLVSRRGGGVAGEGGGEMLRSMERRAAAAQQRSLDKKINSLKQEMAEVEALLDTSVASRNVDPTAAERHREGLETSLSAITAQHQAKSIEVAIDLAARAQESANASDGLPGTPDVGAEARGPSPAVARKGRAVGRRRLVGEDDNDKYRKKGGGLFNALSIYLGAAEQLPLPVSIQRHGTTPFHGAKVLVAILVLSGVAVFVVYYLLISGTLKPRDGVPAGGRGWGNVEVD